MVLDLARPSEPWCFAAGSCFFRSCFTGISSSSRRHQFCEQPQATESFDLARPSEPWCFAAGGCFFRSCFTGISSSSRRQQNLSTNAVFLDLLDFSKFPDDTLGSFFAWFWTLLVLPSHGVLLPGAAFFEAVLPASAAAAAATSSASSRRQQNLLTISRQCAVFLGFQTTRLGGFLAWFWNLLVLRSHGVLLPGAAFFEAIVPASAAAAATCEQLQATDSLEKSCFSRISDDTLGSFLAWF